jgi:membrane-associated protease RseP (regulator of RpoE activity)
MNRKLATVALLLLAGCAAVPRNVVNEPSSPQSRYEAEPGRDAATIAELRAAPAPATPEIIAGKNQDGDHARLILQGFVKIGTGHSPYAQAATHEDVLRQGRQVGAERILLYPPSMTDAVVQDDAAPKGEWLAVYYVRFKLPFGATFRDLRPKERNALGAGGIQIGSVVGGTPASRANLIAGDYVLELDGKPVVDKANFQALLRHNAGHAVTLTIVRNGIKLHRPVRLGAMPAAGG